MPRKVDSQYVWRNGEVLAADDAKVSFFAHSMHYGTAVFEGIRAYDGEQGPAVFRLPEHLERLRRSASHYFMEYPYTDEELAEVTCDLIRRSGLRECYIRPVVLTGEGNMGVKPVNCDIDVLFTVWSWGAYLGAGALENGVRVTVAQKVRKYGPESLDPTVKAVGHYLNSVRATKEAEARGFHEAILLNPHGRIAEGSGENIFLVKDGKLRTNPPEESLLPGITRDSVMQIARKHGLEIEISPMGVEDLLAADEAFFTGTAAEVTPIASVDDQPIGAGKRGPITEKLQSDYLASVRGRLEGFESWLTPVAD